MPKIEQWRKEKNKLLRVQSVRTRLIMRTASLSDTKNLKFEEAWKVLAKTRWRRLRLKNKKGHVFSTRIQLRNTLSDCIKLHWNPMWIHQKLKATFLSKLISRIITWTDFIHWNYTRQNNEEWLTSYVQPIPSDSTSISTRQAPRRSLPSLLLTDPRRSLRSRPEVLRRSWCRIPR